MKRFLVCGGLHGCERSLANLRQLVRERGPDGVLFVGGILVPDASDDRDSLRADEIAFMRRFFATLGELEVFTAVLPGCRDTPLEDFLRLGMQAECAYPNVHLAHVNLVSVDGVAVCGIGGTLVEQERAQSDTLSHLRADYFLRSLDRADHPRKILLLSSAPLSLGGGPEGRLLDHLIRRHATDLCIVAGSSAHRGLRRSGRTLIVNPGYLCDGSAAWVDWRRHPGGHVEFLGGALSRRHKEHAAEPMLTVEG